MKPQTIRRKFTYLFAGFFLLVAGTAGVTLWGVAAQKTDALVINLAGRQRMLTQQMTWLALNTPANEKLVAAELQFETTLLALRDGGVVFDPALQPVSLPPAPDAEIKAQLDRAQETWVSFRGTLTALRSSPVDDPEWDETAQALQRESDILLAELDSAVMAFESRAEAKVDRIFWLEIGFVGVASVFLVAGYRLTIRRILEPLASLEAATRRLGQGDFRHPLRADAQDEVGKLSQVFESMRRKLESAHDHLEKQVAQRNHELATTLEFSQEIVAQLDLEHLLDSVVERTRALMQADSVALCLHQADQHVLELAAARGGRHVEVGSQQPVHQGIALQVINTMQVQASENGCSGCSFLHAQGPGHSLAAPLKAGSRYFGAVCLSRNGEQGFDDDEKRALSLLANAAAIAIANAHLVDSNQREAQRAATLAERERLAAELHDSLAQTLSFMRIKTGQVMDALSGKQMAQASTELSSVQSALEMAYAQVRAALAGLQEPLPVGEDLGHKLTECKTEFELLANLPLSLKIENPEALELSAAVQMQVVHIVRGALSNIHRHARAQQVKLHVRRDNRSAMFIIEDDGIGFNPHQRLGDHHLGLDIMRTRAERSGGQLIIESTPGHGSRVTVCFPLSK